MIKPLHQMGVALCQPHLVFAPLAASHMWVIHSEFEQSWLISQDGDYTLWKPKVHLDIHHRDAMMHLIMQSGQNEALLACKQQWSPLSHADDDGPISPGN